jgi:hypothetical protein
MSLFDFPRINVAGTISVNPATANNDDYAGSVALPDDWGPFAGDTLALIDSKLVEARTYGMSDANFIAWVQQKQTFNNVSPPPPPPTTQVVPAEWNYYGDLTTKATGSVVGVQGGAAGLAGASLTFSGGMCDINSQGSPPATQFFIDQLTLTSGGNVVIQGQPSKGACQWINFYRNVNLQADGGAGGYIYHVLLKSTPETIIDLPELQDPSIAGVILRYYLFNVQQKPFDYTKKKQPNPATIQFVGTIAPLRADEDLLTGPTGRLLISNTTPITTPTTNNNGGGKIALAPAVLQQRGNVISADFSGTFPDNYNGTTNPKFDFGPVALVAVGGGTAATIANVDYTDLAGGNARGWIFDFDISANADAQAVLKDANATFRLLNGNVIVLDETDYYVVTNQQAVYAEQYGAGDLFLNQGTLEPATVGVYRRGQRLDAKSCPPITVWQYRSIPLQSPGNAEVNAVNVLPGDPISIDTAEPGNYLLTFTINDAANPAPKGYPPKSYLAFQNPPFTTVMNSPAISVRILPNNEDFSRYYVDPASEEPTGNELLTFDVIYRKVLRTYYVLYPAMNKVFPLNDEEKVTKYAQAILDRTELSLWMTTSYMPRTRDMSASRRRLLRAWCRKVS